MPNFFGKNQLFGGGAMTDFFIKKNPTFTYVFSRLHKMIVLWGVKLRFFYFGLFGLFFPHKNGQKSQIVCNFSRKIDP